MRIICAALCVAVGMTVASWASADTAQYKDTCTVSPHNCKILKEDDTFRVIDYTAKKGDKVGMHSHPSHVIYVLEGGKTKFTMPDGSTKELDTKAGDVLLNPPTVHASEHLSNIHVIIVELKK